MGSITHPEPGQPKETDKIDELSGKLSFNHLSPKLMHSVVDGDKQTIENGKLISDAISHSLSSFTPDLMFEQLVKNYAMARQIYGKSILRQVTGYDEKYLDKNIRIPEFQRELMKRIHERVLELKQKKLLDNKHTITDKAIELACLVMFTEELDKLAPRGSEGEKPHKKTSAYGDRQDIKSFAKHDRYKDISVHKTVKTALRREHPKPLIEDIKVFKRQARGQIYIIYALDASGSMKGKKIDSCKRAGIALAYKAIDENDKVGLIVFGKDVEKAIAPTGNFSMLIKEIATIRASSETDIAKTIKKAVEMFPKYDVTKHLVLITDAMPTAGKQPEKQTLEAVSLAKACNITMSLVGIQLSKKGKELAEKIVEIGKGKLYSVKDTEDVDRIVLEDYYAIGEY